VCSFNVWVAVSSAHTYIRITVYLHTYNCFEKRNSAVKFILSQSQFFSPYLLVTQAAKKRKCFLLFLLAEVLRMQKQRRVSYPSRLESHRKPEIDSQHSVATMLCSNTLRRVPQPKLIWSDIGRVGEWPLCEHRTSDSEASRC
jgi:hypothetical protein